MVPTERGVKALMPMAVDRWMHALVFSLVGQTPILLMRLRLSKGEGASD
jgi:hypothetical protein